MTLIQINRDSGIPQTFNNDAFDAMISQYSYMPHAMYDFTNDRTYFPIDEYSKIIRELVDLKPGQSAAPVEISNVSSDLKKSPYLTRSIWHYLKDIIKSEYFKVVGHLFDFKHVVIATKNADGGCTAHHTIEIKFRDSEEMIFSRWSKWPINFDSFNRQDVAHQIGNFAEESGYDLSTADGRTAFLKDIRDDNLIKGVDLSHITDEDIENLKTRDIGIDHYDVSDFILKTANIDARKLMNCMIDTSCKGDSFDLSQLSFTFDYDQVIDGDTFRRFYTVADSLEQYNAKPEVLSILDRDSIDNHLHDFDLDDLADQIIAGEKTIVQYCEEDPDFVDNSRFFEDIEESVSCDEYIFRSQGGFDGYELTVTRLGSEPIYEFAIRSYLLNEPFDTYIKIGKGTYRIHSAKLDKAFKRSTLVNRLADLLGCSVSELPAILTNKGLAKFSEDDFIDYEAPDESEVYEWFENYATNSDICRVIEEAELLPDVSHLHNEPFSKFELDFTDCIPKELYSK